ncbi:MAG TPA: RsmE family RNA methyltransferase [Terriglobales bacterium]|nr:RsmE family RNA methyltransferase [Terriglobales bacterium]
MTRRRWIADEASGTHASLLGDHARHLAQVLRAHIGQQFEISVNGNVHLGRITTISPDRVEFELGDVVTVPEPLPITVAISIFKFDRLEWAIEKCTELGVARIVPLIAARTETHLASAAEKRVERWRRMAKQAAEQSRRTSPPHVADPIKFRDFAAAVMEGSRVFLSEVEQEVSLKDAITPGESLTLAFGPEGGWKEQELAAFAGAGWKSASLGPTILRAETAVIAAVAVAASML